MAKRRNTNGKGGAWFPVSPMAPPETQGVGWAVVGLFGTFKMFWSAITGKNHDAWYDRVLHVIGGLLILGLLIGGVVQTIFGRWKH